MGANMDFGRILNEWDKRSPAVRDYKKDDDTRVESKADERKRLMNKRPDAVIDLHGQTKDEAWESLDEFFRISRSRGLEKVLIIHGKGNHANSEGALRVLSRQFIELCPFAGASGHSNAANGGSGATWVLLKD
jgi:DNA-nicking Smr family endonuclease